MDDTIREDVESEIATLIVLLRRTFDPSGYPDVAAGAEFDARCGELDDALARVRCLFNDYLMQSWSDEIQGFIDSARAQNRDDS